LRVRYRPLSEQKAGNDPSENEDWFEPRIATDGILESDIVVVTLVDGASDCVFSKLWAHVLAGEFYEMSSASSVGIETLQKSVRRGARMWKRFVKKETLPWYAAEKARRGAYATLIGACLTSSGEVKAISLGDTVLAQIRNDELTATFPEMKPEDFGNNPNLLSTDDTYNRKVWSGISTHEGTWHTGDRFLFMTDALAQWFLTQASKNERPWNTLAAFGHDENEQFPQWVATLRDSKLIRNDDVTLLTLEVVSDDSGND
jgi:hypothetical protein